MPILKLLFYPPPQDLYTHALFERLSLSPIMNNSPSYTTHPPIHIVFVFCVVFSCPLLVIVINSPPVRQVDCDRLGTRADSSVSASPMFCPARRLPLRPINLLPFIAVSSPTPPHPPRPTRSAPPRNPPMLRRAVPIPYTAPDTLSICLCCLKFCNPCRCPRFPCPFPCNRSLISRV